MKNNTFVLVAVCFASALLGAGVASYAVVRNTSTATTIEYVNRDGDTVPIAKSQFVNLEQSANYPDLTFAAENAVKAVVNIEAVTEVEVQQGMMPYNPFFEFFGFPQPQQGGQSQKREQKSGGSGVIISTDGYIVTNNHVVDGATKLRVKLNDGRVFDAKIIGKDPTTDVALIKVEAENLPILKFGSSDALRLGEWVLAIGSPFDLQSTITAGIVSAKARQLDVIPNEFRIESFIQTDAAVNPGNSGGALVNTKGELVGINTVIKSSTGSYIGYSFAVPESIVRKVVNDLREYGIVQRALLGISYRYIDQDFIDQLGKDTGIKEVGGVYVAGVVEGGSASEAGLRKGDVITEIDGVKITAPTTLTEQIGKHRPNDKISLVVKRGDKVKHFEVVLRNKAGKAELLSKNDVDVVEVLGGRFADIDDRAARKLDIRGGVQVQSVKSGGLLAKARVREGFIITHINDKVVRSVADLGRLTDKIQSIDGVYPDGKSASYTIINE
ncbi:MAG: Do family serine endopeptidase [Alistipes sp.]|nr:Do family serine endopeptidase [Rikenellaceae bacterium]MBR1962592.1 Do family serine endopeptidase [Alistipes sp.]